MSYLTTVLADAPRNYWRLTELGGQIIHDVGSAPYAIEANENYGHLGYTGIASDGGSVRVPNGPFITELGIASPALLPPWSLECWVWKLGYFGIPQTFVDLGGMALQMNGATSTPQFFANPSNLNSTGGDVSVRQWHHIVGTLGGGNMNLYVDAINRGTLANGTSPAVSQTMIGAYQNASRAFDGFICEVAVYPVALTPARVTAHFLAQEVGSSPNWRAQGTTDLATGSATVLFQTAQDILASVRKIFPTT